MEEIEYNQRVVKIVETLTPKGRAERHEIDELFMLYNMKFKPRETGKHCAGCVQRVMTRIDRKSVV